MWLLNKDYKSVKKISCLFCLWISLFSALNVSHFFIQESKEPVFVKAIIKDLSDLNYKVYAGQSSYYDPQPINLLYHGQNPNNLMKNVKWIKNKTFSADKISLSDYISLMRDKTPPVSDLFWNELPQNTAFQEEGDLVNRNHLRWWYAGLYQNKPLWVGAISYDNEIEISLYKGIITILHDIDREVDKERDRLKTTIKSKRRFT